MDEKVNIFIAFMLSQKALSEMAKVADNVKELFQPDGKDEKFFHCTLLFIGRVGREYVPSIQEKLKGIAATQQQIPLTIDDIGYFYSEKKDRIKVLYAKPHIMPTELTELCSKLYEIIGKPLDGKTTPPIHEVRIHFTITKKVPAEIYQKIMLDKLEVNAGMLMENVVAQMLVANGHKLYFYSNSDRENKENRMEIDFLIAKSKITNKHNISPIEVKSGKNYTLTSIRKCIDKYKEFLSTPYVLHTSDIKTVNGIVYLPIYMTELL